MYDKLVKLLESGLDGDVDNVKTSAEEFVKQNLTKAKERTMPFEYRLAKRYKKILDGRNNS